MSLRMTWRGTSSVYEIIMGGLINNTLTNDIHRMVCPGLIDEW